MTGSTDGIGKQTALELARRDFRVVIHGRNRSKAESALRDLEREEPAAEWDLVTGDLSSLAQVRELAQTVLRKCDRLDVLVNNAGVFMTERVVTEDGFETTFAVNHLAPFLLTQLLQPALERAAQATGEARVVTVSSVAHTQGEIPFDDLQLARGFDGYQAYANSKLANVLFAFELARRVQGAKITSNALHPGAIDTKLLHTGFGMRGASWAEGARTPVYLASDPKVGGVTGHYFVNGAPAKPIPEAEDASLARRLWDVSAQLVGLG